MSVLVIADLHLDFWLQARRDPFAGLSTGLLSSLDGLIIAGDLSNKPKVRWPHMIRHLARYVPRDRIYLLAGNHDFYDHAIDGEDRLGEICVDGGANFVQKSVVVIGHTRFLCCTLWTDFTLYGDPARAMAIAQRDVNDYKYIRHIGSGYRKLRPTDTLLLHTDHRLWLEEQLSAAFDGRTFVVTHHCPHPDLIGESRTALDPVYGSNLLPLIEQYQPNGWFFGHTHRCVEAQVGRTFVRNISLGYPDQVVSGHETQIMLRGLMADVSR